MKLGMILMFVAGLLAIPSLAQASPTDDYCYAEAYGGGSANGNASWCSFTGTSPLVVKGPDWGSNVCAVTTFGGYFHNTSFDASHGDYVYVDRVADGSKSSGYAWEMVMHGSGDHIAGTMTCVPLSKFTFSTVTNVYHGGNYVSSGNTTPSLFASVNTQTNSFCFLNEWVGIQRNQYDYADIYPNQSGPTGYYDLTITLGRSDDEIYTNFGCLSAGTSFVQSSTYGINTYSQSQKLPDTSKAFCFFNELEGPWTDVESWVSIQNNPNGSRLLWTMAGTQSDGVTLNQTPGAAVTCAYY